MFRFYFNNDSTEDFAITFHFSTSKFVLALKKQDILFDDTLEGLFAQLVKYQPEKHEMYRNILQDAFDQKKAEFELFLQRTEKEIRAFHDWLGRHEGTHLPVGLGYIKNPSDPTKGSKNTMSGTP